MDRITMEILWSESFDPEIIMGTTICTDEALARAILPLSADREVFMAVRHTSPRTVLPTQVTAERRRR